MAKPKAPGRVLIIAGSDSGGGAGIQADIKTVTAMGGYAMTAITALTAQNTTGVYGIHDVPEWFIRKQIMLVLSDIGADSIKTGMLSTPSILVTVAACIRRYARDIPFVLDPVMVAKGGAPLLRNDAVDILKEKLLPMASLVTPNIPEAELLTGISIRTTADMQSAGEKLLKMGAKAALIKGGHMGGNQLTDLLVTDNQLIYFKSKRINTLHTHGTGCTFASAIATGLANRQKLEKSVYNAKSYLISAIKAAPGFGKGHGPLHHGVSWQKGEA